MVDVMLDPENVHHISGVVHHHDHLVENIEYWHVADCQLHAVELSQLAVMDPGQGLLEHLEFQYFPGR